MSAMAVTSQEVVQLGRALLALSRPRPPPAARASAASLRLQLPRRLAAGSMSSRVSPALPAAASLDSLRPLAPVPGPPLLAVASGFGSASASASLAAKLARGCGTWGAASASGSNSGSGSAEVAAAVLASCRQARRSYMESSDRRVAVRALDDPVDVLNYYAANSDMDISTLEATLRALFRATSTPTQLRAVVDDERFTRLLASVAAQLDDADARILSKLSNAVANYRVKSPELQDLCFKIAEVSITRENGFSPRQLATLALGLAVRGVRDPALVEFVRLEAIKSMNDFEPSDLHCLLEAQRRWGIYDRELVNIIVERMSDDVDRFTARDVISTLEVLANMALARGFLIRRLTTLCFENVHQFEPRQLVQVASALCKLRFLTVPDMRAILDVVVPAREDLGPRQLSDTIFVIAMLTPTHGLTQVEPLVEQFMAEERARGIDSLIDVAWALCAFNRPKFLPMLKSLLADVFDTPVSKKRVTLQRINEVINCIDLEYPSLGVSVPSGWRGAAAEAESMEQDKLENSRLHAELVLFLDNMRQPISLSKAVVAAAERQAKAKAKAKAGADESSVPEQPPSGLHFVRSQPLGPYRVDLYDEVTKLVVDVEGLNRPVSRTVKHRHLSLAHIGAKCTVIDYWWWRRCKTEDEQTSYLTSVLCEALGVDGPIKIKQ